MKRKYRWNKRKFARNILAPIGIMLLFMAMSICPNTMM